MSAGTRPLRLVQTELPDFILVPLSPEAVVATAHALVGVPYNPKATFVEWVDGVPRGYCNCWGLLLVVCERLGLIDRDFWRALQIEIARRGVAQTLRRLLQQQMIRVDQDEARPSDVALFRWRGDGREWVGEEEAVEGAFHHIAFLTGTDPQPLGSMVHATETAADSSGQVLESPIMPHDWSQLHSVWRFPQLREAQDG